MTSKSIHIRGDQPHKGSPTRGWRFYGRQSQFRLLETFLSGRADFNVLAIRGRRQVGKTDLIETFFERRQQEGDKQNLIYCELLRRDKTREDFFNRLEQAVRKTNRQLLEGFAVEPNGENFKFSDLAEHLLRRGCVVVLDEFQRIRSTNGAVESEFQFLIDRLRREARKKINPRSRLIVLGSEQQRLVEMFKHPTAPMYGRVRNVLHLQPWTFAEFKEMAIEQGWDQNPNRLLTLWTAYNGLPGHWGRFWEEEHLSDFSRIADDREWTSQFLEVEGIYRTSPGGGFYNQMEVELRASDLALVRWLASRPSGYNITRDLRHRAHRVHFNKIKMAVQREQPDEKVTDSDVAAEVEEAIRSRLSGDHLGLLERKPYWDDRKDIKWRVCDNFARFQVEVLERIEATTQEDPTVITPEDIGRRQSRLMTTLEGYGLESFAAEFFRDMVEHGSSVFPKGNYKNTIVFLNLQTKFPAEAEFDVMVVMRPSTKNKRQGHLWVVSAKRRPSLHDVKKDLRALDRFFDPLDSPHIAGLFQKVDPNSYQRHYVFLSPTMNSSARMKCKANAIASRQSPNAVSRIDHWYSMTIADMMSGRGPQPLDLAS
ncbi:MAG: AAA family ATPase [Aestuariivita sp.]|nr:AAA family ATPase [Aestuariivita sp.]MCY4201128.1 AAA family ATPase [Aestuariivita sp.]